MTILTKAVKVADPYRHYFPKNNPDDCFARSIWDMCYFNGRIYVGCGDLWANRGPIMINSFTSNKAGINIREEVEIEEEMVNNFRVYNNILFIPGADPTYRDSESSGNYGSYYFKSTNLWEIRRTIENAIHVYDLAMLKNQLFIAYSTKQGRVVRR